MPSIAGDLKRLYSARFGDRTQYRRAIWGVLMQEFFSKFIRSDASVLDLGCGYGEFINSVRARRRFAVDMNPDARQLLATGIQFLEQDCSAPWQGIVDESLDLVFTSNFLEHLPSKDLLRKTIQLSFGALKRGGCLIAMGPNIRFTGDAYWDFWDHHLPLTERSLSEVLQSEGFTVERCIPRFLPFTMSEGFQYPPFFLRVYLRIPPLWKIFGAQFLVIVTKP